MIQILLVIACDHAMHAKVLEQRFSASCEYDLSNFINFLMGISN